MQQIHSVVLGASLLALAGSAGAQSAPPPGTEVHLKIEEQLDSSKVHTGQHFALSVDQDVVVDGQVLIPKGAKAEGTVLFARKKGVGRSGALDVRVDWVDSIVGHLRTKAIENHRGKYLAREQVMVQAVFGVVGFLVQGDNIIMPVGATINAQVAPGAPVMAAAASVDAVPASAAAPAIAAPQSPSPSQGGESADAGTNINQSPENK